MKNIFNLKFNNFVNCDYAKNKTFKLAIPFKIWSEWLYIMHQYPDTEFSCVFWVNNDVVTRYEIPQQEVSSASVEMKDTSSANGIMHSHHKMGAFHSHQDDEQTRNLYEYSIVLAFSGYNASKRIKTPCNAFAYANLEIVIPDLPKHLSTSELQRKIKEKQYFFPDKHFSFDKKDDQEFYKYHQDDYDYENEDDLFDYHNI